jgi:hypothetical protein
MYSIDATGRGHGLVLRPSPGLVGFGLLLLLVLAALVASRAVFPFFPLFPVVLFFAMRMIGSAAWRGGPAAPGRPTVNPPALPSGIGQEKELLRALERHGEITAVRATLETSLGVADAEEMLSGLANEGHVRVIANGGRLAYALWE